MFFGNLAQFEAGLFVYASYSLSKISNLLESGRACAKQLTVTDADGMGRAEYQIQLGSSLLFYIEFIFQQSEIDKVQRYRHRGGNGNGQYAAKKRQRSAGAVFRNSDYCYFKSSGYKALD